MTPVAIKVPRQTYKNPNEKTYSKLARTQATRVLCAEPYSENWDIFLKPDLMEWLRSKIRGRLLIDLGAGEPGYMMKLAKTLEAREYVAVDSYDRWRVYTDKTGKVINNTLGLVATAYLADMLEFVSRIESRSANFTINGIDDFVLVEPFEYANALAREIERATEVGGVVFGLKSRVLSSLDPTVFRRIDTQTIPEPKISGLYEKT